MSEFLQAHKEVVSYLSQITKENTLTPCILQQGFRVDDIYQLDVSDKNKQKKSRPEPTETDFESRLLNLAGTVLTR